MHISAPSPPTASSSTFRPALEIYSEEHGTERLVRRFGEPATGDPVLDAAYDHALAALRLFHDSLGWSGWDGKGGVTRVIANSSQYTHWSRDTGTAYLNKDGDGGLKPTAFAADVVAHEIGHGVAVTRNPSIHGNSALGQTLANTFAMVLDPDDWKLGEDVFQAHQVYDYSNPNRRFPDVESTAMALIGDAIGRESMMRMFFEATPTFSSSDDVATTAKKTVDAARRLNLPSQSIEAIERAWNEAITPAAAT